MVSTKYPQYLRVVDKKLSTIEEYVQKLSITCISLYNFKLRISTGYEEQGMDCSQPGIDKSNMLTFSSLWIAE